MGDAVGNPLAVQRIGLCAFTVQSRGSVTGLETKIPQTA